MTPTRTRAPGRTAGFTLVELMVAVALAGVVVAFVFGIHGQMVGAMRGQASISEIVETVTAAREVIAKEARLAGQGFPKDGVKWGNGPTQRWLGVDVVNDVDVAGADMADEIQLQRTEGDVYTTTFLPNGQLTLAAADTLGFVVGEPIMLMKLNGVLACSAPVVAVTANDVTVDPLINDPGGPCMRNTIPTPSPIVTDGEDIVIARIYRIGFRLDPNAATFPLGVLQQTLDGGATWTDLGIGYSNLQFAVRYFEPTNAVDADGDGDPTKDWYSGDNLEVAAAARPVDADTDPPPADAGRPMQIGISDEGRNLRRLEIVPATFTPVLQDPVRPDNNPIGNWPGIPDIAVGPLPPRYDMAEKIYRASSTTVFLRSRLGAL